MASTQDLEALARQRHPVTTVPGATGVEQLAAGFVAAKQAMFRHISKGQTLDYETAQVATERARIQIDQNIDIVRLALERGEDLPRAYALALDANELRSLFLAKYTLACEGIGAYVSGYMRDAADRGTITRADYDEGIEVRLNAFGTLVAMDESGDLRSVLVPEESSQRVMQLVSASATPEKPAIIFLETKKKTVYVSPPVARPGVQGVGAIPVGLALVIGICAVLLVAAIAHSINTWHRDSIMAQMARERCLEADKYGYQETIKWCNDYASGVDSNPALLEEILGKKTISTLGKYATVAAIAYIGLLFAPEIIRSFSSVSAEKRKALGQGV
jgi:hypothetical protein